MDHHGCYWYLDSALPPLPIVTCRMVVLMSKPMLRSFKTDEAMQAIVIRSDVDCMCNGNGNRFQKEALPVASSSVIHSLDIERNTRTITTAID